MKQSEKLLKLKDAGTILINLGILIMCITPVIMVAREVYDFHAWLTVWRWGVGIAFTGLVIRISRFLYLWQISLGQSLVAVLFIAFCSLRQNRQCRLHKLAQGCAQGQVKHTYQELGTHEREGIIENRKCSYQGLVMLLMMYYPSHHSFPSFSSPFIQSFRLIYS